MPDQSVRKGVGWLEGLQRVDGGWPSSATDDAPTVFPTTCAVRALARFGRTDPVARGVAWLRIAQCTDGGWAATGASGGDARRSSPAYTAYAVVALLIAGVRRDDTAVRRGCDYLRATFRADLEEPWESTSFTSVIDPSVSARMDFRHFATPWALVALGLAGHDLSDPLILTGVSHLLKQQKPSGAWRCSLTAPDSTPIWAIHDALYALRTILDGASHDLVPMALHGHLNQERAELHRLVVRLLSRPRLATGRRGALRSRVQSAWLSALTVAVVVIVLTQTGVIQHLDSTSVIEKSVAGLATVVGTVLGAIAPVIVTEEYRIRRSRGSSTGRGGGS